MAALPNIPFSDEEAENFYAYAYAQYGSGNWPEAADVFRILCTRRPFEGRFWFGLGATLQGSESYENALQAWAMAALLLEQDPYPHFHAAECYLSLQQNGEAIKALNAAERLASSEHLLTEKIKVLKEQWQIDYGHS